MSKNKYTYIPLKKTTPAKEAATEMDWTKAKEHLKDVIAYYHTFVGKPGYNPFLFLASKGIPELKDQVATGVTTPELYTKIMALTKEEPKI